MFVQWSPCNIQFSILQAAMAAEIRAATERVSEFSAHLDVTADAEKMR